MAIPVLQDTSFSGDITLDGGLYVPAHIFHKGDTDTYIGFNLGDDTFQIVCGGSEKVDWNSSGMQLGSGARVTTILDEDAMGSNSATALATQQSIKAYADANITGSITTATSIYNTSLLIGRAAGEQYIAFDVDDKVVIHAAGTEYRFIASALVPGTNNARDLGSTVKKFKDLHLGGDLYVDGSILQGTPTTPSESSGTHTVVLADNDNHNIACNNEATTIALTVASSDIGKSGIIVIKNPSSVGSLSFVALPSYMLTPGGATLNFVTTANAISIISYYVHATDKVLVNYVGNFA